MSGQPETRNGLAGLIACCITAGMLAAVIAAFAIWGWQMVFGAVVLAGGAYWWAFRTEYNNPGWRDRRR